MSIAWGRALLRAPWIRRGHAALNSVAGRLFALLCGPLLCVGLYCLYCLLPSHYADSAGHSVVFSIAARGIVGCIAWTAVWWLSEVVPLAATSLLPGMLFPLLGVASLEATFAPYADPLLFLFLGGFAIASAVLMLPVALSIASHASATRSLRKCLMLAVAYGSTIGGMGTLIGTPPNVFVASFLRSSYGVSLDFWKWLAIGLPMVAVMLPFTFWLLTRMRLPVSRSLVLTFPDDGEQSLRWSHLLTPVEAAVVTGPGASSAYRLPVGTAPNALAYGSGFLTTRNMAGTGIVLNLVSIALIVLVTCWVVPRVL